jgi:uncharacterized protein (DUF1810 family)
LPGVVWFGITIEVSSMVSTPDFNRFIAAQDPVLPRVRRELSEGRKRSHWMWFVFPQLAGLGRSPTAQHYAIGSLDAAQAYLADPVLGPRLTELTGLVNQVAGQSATAIFGSPDDMKFHSCMTLFHRAAPAEPTFRLALKRYFDGALDQNTLDRLGLDGPN